VEKFSQRLRAEGRLRWPASRTCVRAWRPAKRRSSGASTAGDVFGSLFSRTVSLWRARLRKVASAASNTVLVDVVDTALEFVPQADQGVVDVGDVAAVRHAGQTVGPPMGCPLEG
jgi:hypothetical protein